MTFHLIAHLFAKNNVQHIDYITLNILGGNFKKIILKT